jgi:nucleotide-binding universal stress UspA family protein
MVTRAASLILRGVTCTHAFLFPLDGSTTALQVLPYAKVIARSTGAAIALLQSLNESPRELITTVSHSVMTPKSFPPPAEAWRQLKASALAATQAKLEQEAAHLKAEGFQVTTITVEEDAADAIVQEAEKDPGTLIAISTHGRSGIGRWMMGSVTDKVVRQAINPVLVVRARAGEVTSSAPQLKQVVLPLDGSERSGIAVTHAIEMAKALNVGVTLVRSISPMAYGDTFADYVPSMYENLADEIKTDVQDFLAHQAQQLRAAGVANVAEKAVDGYAASAILDEVGEVGDSIVVMATHGRAGIGRWVLGSVSDRVIRHSTGPVLVVRPGADS